MIAIGFDKRKLAELRAAVGDVPKKLPRELATAVNATVRQAKKQVSVNVRKDLAINAKGANEAIATGERATAAKASSQVTLRKEFRPSLKRFGARQTKSGVSAKVLKSGSRTIVQSGFMGPKPGQLAAKLNGHAFKRVGKSRYPIVKLKGISPWGIFVKRNMTPPTIKQIGAELEKQINKRIRFLLLKSQNKLNWQQKGR